MIDWCIDRRQWTSRVSAKQSYLVLLFLAEQIRAFSRQSSDMRARSSQAQSLQELEKAHGIRMRAYTCASTCDTSLNVAASSWHSKESDSGAVSSNTDDGNCTSNTCQCKWSWYLRQHWWQRQCYYCNFCRITILWTFEIVNSTWKRPDSGIFSTENVTAAPSIDSGQIMVRTAWEMFNEIQISKFNRLMWTAISDAVSRRVHVNFLLIPTFNLITQ